MPTEYVNVTLADMEAFLLPQGFVKMDLRAIDPDDRTQEAVYGKRNDIDGKPVTIRVYTGIVGAESRDVGADAIRINIFTRKSFKEERTGQLVNRSVLIAGSKRVHRVKNWRSNLQQRLDKWQDNLKICPDCGNFLKVRKGSKGEFLGCLSYPICKHSENLPG